MNTAPAVKAIETRAYGHRFRSRLEARFAVFFTELGLSWQYEPEGFELSSGCYLPDFYLPSLRAWIEVKPYGSFSYFGWGACAQKGIEYAHDPRLLDFAVYAQSVEQHFYVAHGLPSEDLFCSLDYSSEGMLEAPWDPFAWCVCKCGASVGIEFDGRGDRINCRNRACTKSGHGDKGYSHDHPKIVNAARKARSTRFERREGPQ